MNKYIGITIGPIVETMMQTSTPAGLWYASYFFSSVSRDLCIELQNKEYEILSLPRVESKPLSAASAEHDNEGIGRFHDRIYFKTEKEWDTEVKKDIETAIDDVLEKRAGELANCLPGDNQNTVQAKLKDFLQIHYVCIEEEQADVVSKLADALDTLELTGKVMKDPENNPLYKVIRGTKGGSNPYIKELQVMKDAVDRNSERFLLAARARDKDKDLTIHDIAWIASLGKKEEEIRRKTEKYFAIVQCDGDNMGAIAKKEHDGNGLGEGGKNFSNLCWDYTKESVDLISRFGGVVIYAGGDDLLFLAPVIGSDINDSQKKITVWELCKEISKRFDKSYKEIYGDENRLHLPKKKAKPSLSFGVSINYNHYPLYEAFGDARDLLFDVAKKFYEGRAKEKHKNNIAIKVHKASGQTAGIVCCMNTNGDASVLANQDNTDGKNVKANTGDNPSVFDEFLKLINEFFIPDGQNGTSDENKKNEIMHSLLYHIESMQALFQVALKKETLTKNAFRRVFDNASQAFGSEMVEEIANLSVRVHEEYENKLIKGLNSEENDSKDKNDVFALTSMLRIAKFLLEDE